MNKKVFLMGNSGASKWRDPYMQAAQEADLEAFNPVKANWTPDDAKIEARVLVDSDTIIMVITTETEAIGSLIETGWIIVQALLKGKRVGMLITNYSAETKIDHDASARGRSLALAHAEELSAAYPDMLYLAASHADLIAWMVAPIPVG